MLRVIIVLGSLLVVARLAGLLTGPSDAAATVAEPSASELLPPTNVDSTRSYDGRSPGASWRIAAAERIETSRKGDLRIIVKDKSGRPLPGARVQVQMLRHGFRFGSAVSSDLILDERSDDGHTYRRKLLELFNAATPEHALGWTESQRDPQRGRRVVDWLLGQDMAVRGQTMLFPSWRDRKMPPELQREYMDRFETNPDAADTWLREQTLARVQSASRDYAGQLYAWDVVGDMANNHALIDILGPEILATWFTTARDADPATPLFIADQSALADGGLDYTRQDRLYETIQWLRATGAPVSGIGLEGHFDQVLTTPERMGALINRFGGLGLPIQITAFDIETSDEQLQADYLRDMMTMAFSQPSVQGFTVWGFWEGRHWRPGAALIRKDWSEKPAATAYRDLVYGQWWTSVSGDTDAQGALACRGFLGDYQITLDTPQGPQIAKTTLTRDGTTLTITVE